MWTGVPEDRSPGFEAGSTLPSTLAGPELAVIVPTFNEAANVEILAQKIGEVLANVRHEIIFVDDDSPDGTADTVRDLSQRNGHIRCLQRVGRRGLSSAVIEGILSTTAPYAAVIDGDLQHDERALPQMLAQLRDGEADVVVGSRYMDGGGVGDWSEARVRQSQTASHIARRLTGVNLSDPMSGFFVLRTEVLRDRVRDVSGVGYKILLDLLSTPGPVLKVEEHPYVFRSRQNGESKLDSKVLLEFLELILAKRLGKYVPVKFVMFSLVGGLGIVVHMAALTLLYQGLAVGFTAAQTAATLLAMTANFFVNNVFTYHDRRLRGWRLLPGWLSFCAASSVGALGNVGVASYLFTSFDAVWWASALAGIVVGAAWNYAVTALYTWKA